MRAVNLIPADQQRGAGGAAGRSGGGVYVFLGALALVVALTAAYVVTGKSLTDKRSDLARITQEATQAEGQAQQLASYTKFASIRTKREQTVQQLAAGRFDWSHALHEVARVLPTNAWLTQLTGTTSPTVTLGGAGGGSLRGALAVPAIQIAGCTTSQASVAKMMARMRLIDGVQRVSLESSEKGDNASAGGGSADVSGGSDCRGGSRHFPQFNIVVFFDAQATPTAPAGTTQTAAATTAAGAASTATPSSTPAASTATPATPTTPAASGGTTP
jgi:Tfp pilus assembly protein PilN